MYGSRLITLLVGGCFTLSMTFADSWAYAAPRNDKPGEVVASGPRRHLTTIIFAGLSGAILGLSTLSFYGRPQDRLSNIAVGFAIGIIGGTMFTTYKAAAEPRDFYGDLHENLAPELWSTESWRALDPKPEDVAINPPRASFTFEF